ncbi:hypothetical protein Save01_06254 [Streptomyces avermitilis]
MQPESLADALEGVDRMYLFPVAETAWEVVPLAQQAGVRRIVVLSSGAVTTGFDSDFHSPVERAVEESGLEWTHVRPGETRPGTVPPTTLDRTPVESAIPKSGSAETTPP